MSDNANLIEIIEAAAEMRKDPKVPRDYISEALERIKLGQEQVERYPTGSPSLKGVYEIASRLYTESA